jgi:hypothetical protein
VGSSSRIEPDIRRSSRLRFHVRMLFTWYLSAGRIQKVFAEMRGERALIR